MLIDDEHHMKAIRKVLIENFDLFENELKNSLDITKIQDNSKKVIASERPFKFINDT